MAQVREHPWVTGKPLPLPAENGYSSSHKDLADEEHLVYRGFGSGPAAWDMLHEQEMLDDDEPVYRSLGNHFDDAGGSVEGVKQPPMLKKQKGSRLLIPKG